MSPDELRAAMEASRRFEAETAGAKFGILLPTDHACSVALQTHRGPDGEAIGALYVRALLEQSLISWEGMLVRHVLPDGPGDALPFNLENVALLIEHRPDICNELSVEIGRRLRERRKKLEGHAKNSARASTGS